MKTNLLIAAALLVSGASLAQEATHKQETTSQVQVKTKPAEVQANSSTAVTTAAAVKAPTDVVNKTGKKVRRTQAAVNGQVQATKEAVAGEVKQTASKVDQTVQEVPSVQAQVHTAAGLQATINNRQLNQQAVVDAQAAVSPRPAVAAVREVRTTAVSKVQKTRSVVAETVPAISNTIKPMPVQTTLRSGIKTGIGLGLQ